MNSTTTSFSMGGGGMMMGGGDSSGLHRERWNGGQMPSGGMAGGN
jgi:hypothetical protein